MNINKKHRSNMEIRESNNTLIQSMLVVAKHFEKERDPGLEQEKYQSRISQSEEANQTTSKYIVVYVDS